MIVTASAPGKLVLTGEYAVLEGTPALSLAVSRRARVRLQSNVLSTARLSSIGAGQLEANCRLGPDGPQWQDAGPELLNRLALVDAVLRWRIIDAPQWSAAGFDISLDTSEFFEHGRDTAGKLGLGSSAALTVAFAAALGDYSPETQAVLRPPAVGGAATPVGQGLDRTRLLRQLLRLHREFQGGHGSGVDIATCLFGGLICYRRPTHEDAPARVDAKQLPEALKLLGVWSGRAASTSRFLRALQRWRERDPGGYDGVMRMLDELGVAAECAISDGDPTRLELAVQAYGRGLDELGLASGLDIVSAEHRRIGQLAASEAIVYKPSGAGGGDLGVAISRDHEALARFERALAGAGFTPVELSVDPVGLELGKGLE